MKSKTIFILLSMCIALYFIVGFAMDKCLPEYYELILVDFSKPIELKGEQKHYFNHDFKSIVEEELADDIHPIVKKASISFSESSFIVSPTPPVEVVHTSFSNGTHITKSSGTFNGPSGKETWYNLDMAGVVKIMRGMGFSEEEYPYWVRDDGCKMLGSYIMVAANLELRPRGSLIETSLGTGLVCDTGPFANINKTQLDIAVSW